MLEFSDLTMSRALPGEAALVRQLVREAYARWVPVIGGEPRPMNADYELAVREHEIDLFRAGDEVVALIEMISHPDHLFIENIAVAPAYQGHGLGRHLLKHAEERAARAGLGELRLLTNGAMTANIRLYQATGYRIDRSEQFMDGSVVHMSKANTA